MSPAIARPGTIVYVNDPKHERSGRGEIVSHRDPDDFVQVDKEDGDVLWCHPRILDQLRD